MSRIQTMRIKNPTVTKLLEKYKEIALLSQTLAVLEWDLNVNLPTNASPTRGSQTAYLTELIAHKWREEEFKKLLEPLITNNSRLNTYEQAIVRNLHRTAKYYWN